VFPICPSGTFESRAGSRARTRTAVHPATVLVAHRWSIAGCPLASLGAAARCGAGITSRIAVAELSTSLCMGFVNGHPSSPSPRPACGDERCRPPIALHYVRAHASRCSAALLCCGASSLRQVATQRCAEACSRGLRKALPRPRLSLRIRHAGAPCFGR
jgi:hypothetical protein